MELFHLMRVSIMEKEIQHPNQEAMLFIYHKQSGYIGFEVTMGFVLVSPGGITWRSGML
jgi:hypothetical protein